jgi:hypothetical protein
MPGLSRKSSDVHTGDCKLVPDSTCISARLVVILWYSARC